MARAQQTNPAARTSAAKRTAAMMKKAGTTRTTAKSLPAHKAATAPARKRTPAKRGGRTTANASRGKEGPASRALMPIRSRQSRGELLATVAADSGIDQPIVERVTRSLSATLTRHLIRNGSGLVEIPYLGATLWRGRQGAQKARRMHSGILGGREVNVPGRLSCATPRLRAHQAFRDAVARR